MKFAHLIPALLLLLGPLCLQAQQKGMPLDRIVAVVGDEIILESDVDNQVNYLKINGEKDNGSLRCQVMEELIVAKLLLNKAEQDSITVSGPQIEAELDRRMQYFLSRVKKEEFEEIYGKSIAEFRADIRPDIEDELLVQQQRQVLLSEASITPKEVKAFYNSIPRDSLGLLPAEVQLNHIVIEPPADPASEAKAKAFLLDLRRRVLQEGADFNELAFKFSDEGAARRSRGSLGEFGRGQMVPAFEDVVYQMRVGEISQPFRSEFGFHIVKLEDRKGEVVTASHVLKQVAPLPVGDSLAIDSLNKIRELVFTDSLTFEQAAILHSSDRQSKTCGGCISNPQTGELRIPMDLLDPEMYFKIDEMKPGEISKPMELMQPDGSRAFHIIYLKRKIPPHTPNLQDDYRKIHEGALQAKQAENFQRWLESAKKNIYIDIKPTECSNALRTWMEYQR
jgi:peptidyl-prolyl cis-trans isomerase SurA